MTGTPQRQPADGPRPESLADLLGGRRGAVDATLPPLAFGLGWVLGGLGGGVLAAVLTGTAVAGWRWRRGDRPRSVLVGLLAVCVAALVALRTGRAADFFLLQIAANAASALAWAVSIVVRWPLLGVVVGTALGQRTRWRRDPALLRAYGQVVALTVARAALTWPVIAAALAGSWVVIRRSLPAGHPGLRHPVDPADADGVAARTE